MTLRILRLMVPGKPFRSSAAAASFGQETDSKRLPESAAIAASVFLSLCSIRDDGVVQCEGEERRFVGPVTGKKCLFVPGETGRETGVLMQINTNKQKERKRQKWTRGEKTEREKEKDK